MKKKLLALFIILAMVLTLLPTAALATAGTGGNGTPTVISDEEPEEKEPEQKPEEKEPEQKPEEKEPEQKPEEKEPEQKPEEKEPEQKPEESDGNEKKEEEKKEEESGSSGTTTVTCTNNSSCAATSNHLKTCPKGCTGKSDCPNDAGYHNKNCYKLCTGKTDCPNEKSSTSYHQTDCLALCTKNTSCKNTQGKAAAHQEGCPMAVSADPVNPKSVSYDPSTGALSWVMPSTVTADTAVSSGNSDFKVDIQDSDGKSMLSKTIVLAYKGTNSAYTVSIKDSTFSATVPQPSSLTVKTQYSLVIWNSGVSSGTVSAKFTAVDTTTSVPSAGSVTSAEAAAEALETVQKMDAAKLASSLETALSSGVSSSSGAPSSTVSSSDLEAAKKVLSDLAALDKAIQKQANIKVDVVSAANAPSALSVSSITIDNAALNAKESKNATVELEVYASHTSHLISDTYNRDTAVAFGMSMTNVVSTSNLVVPVVITMPVPSGLNAGKVVVLHYRGSGDAYSTIYPSVSGSSISFVVTGFSDFVLAEAVSSGSQNGVTVTSGFPDVPASSTFAAPIAWAQQNGILGGYADGTFRPDNSTTRQALWMVLARMSGASPADMTQARVWSMNSGVSDGTNPQNPLTRQQLITMLYRFAKNQGKTLSGSADLSGYSDNSAVASYAKEALAWGVANGIITGTNDGKLNPQGTATRAHFAAFLYRYANV